mgnify:CR=1 FL=1|jgi:plasmid stability protein
MPSIVIRNIPERTKQALKELSASHGISMEEEARRIITAAVTGGDEDQRGLADRIRMRYVDEDDPILILPSRDDAPRSADMS